MHVTGAEVIPWGSIQFEVAAGVPSSDSLS